MSVVRGGVIAVTAALVAGGLLTALSAAAQPRGEGTMLVRQAIDCSGTGTTSTVSLPFGLLFEGFEPLQTGTVTAFTQPGGVEIGAATVTVDAAGNRCVEVIGENNPPPGQYKLVYQFGSGAGKSKVITLEAPPATSPPPTTPPPVTTTETTPETTSVTTPVTTSVTTPVTTEITTEVTTPVTTSVTTPITTDETTTTVTTPVTTTVTTPVTTTVTTPVSTPATIELTSPVTTRVTTTVVSTPPPHAGTAPQPELEFIAQPDPVGDAAAAASQFVPGPGGTGDTPPPSDVALWIRVGAGLVTLAVAAFALLLYVRRQRGTHT